MSSMVFSVDHETLRPIITATIAETLAVIRQAETDLGDRLAVDETEAARMLGLERHQLRDERGRGRIGCSQIVGRRIRYTREDLLAYLAASRTEARFSKGVTR